jgi:hypothetical protein
VIPFYPFVTVTTQRTPSFSETLQMVWRHLRGVGPNWRERAREARMVDALAEVMAAETEVDEAAETETTNPLTVSRAAVADRWGGRAK